MSAPVTPRTPEMNEARLTTIETLARKGLNGIDLTASSDEGVVGVIREWCRDALDLVAALRASRTENETLRAANVAIAKDEWHEDRGAVLWWWFDETGRISEPPYAGTPLDSDFPEYVTHFTEIAVPWESSDVR